ncbi:hypothetical protein [Streptomyces sp. NPDC012888]|uniref:hypothetical protein n=1 Tax=Streptomyces sp. NPDC012888 TaxID=3364855 RepID=UPI00368C1E16
MSTVTSCASPAATATGSDGRTDMRRAREGWVIRSTLTLGPAEVRIRTVKENAEPAGAGRTGSP